MMQVERPSEGQYMMPIAWYFAPDGAKTIRGLNAFTSGIWDRDKPAQAPLLGDQQPYESPYYGGKNLWGYTGQCRIGTADQFANGLSAAELAAPLDPIPLCCATPRMGQTWFLRHNLTPPQTLVPGQIVGSNWDNVGDPIVAGLISDTPGNVVEGPTFTAALFTGNAPDKGFVQYLTPPLPAQIIPAQEWLLALGRIYGSTGGPQIGKLFTLSVIDGPTGSQKSEPITGHTIGQEPMLTFGVQGEANGFFAPAITLDFGDYLCLEIGWGVFRFPNAPITYGIAIRDSGTTPIPIGHNPNDSPLALLQWPLGGGDSDMPATGSILPFGGPVVPFGYLPCDGSLRNAADFPLLFAAVGTLWGVGGPGTFALPDFRGRTVIGTSPGGLGPTRPTARVLAAVTGEETHVLTDAELAAHSHGVTDPGHIHTVTDPGHDHLAPSGDAFVTSQGGLYNTVAGPSQVNTAPFAANTVQPNTTGLTVDAATTGITTNPDGGGAAHNNMQPSAVITWIIKT
jgi:microcystin-dependent protein